MFSSDEARGEKSKYFDSPQFSVLAALQPKKPKQENHQQIEAIRHFLQHFLIKKVYYGLCKI